jgi:hypothetical protein
MDDRNCPWLPHAVAAQHIKDGIGLLTLKQAYDVLADVGETGAVRIEFLNFFEGELFQRKRWEDCEHLDPTKVRYDRESLNKWIETLGTKTPSAKTVGTVRSKGAPPKPFKDDVIIHAGAWLHANGLPERQARLEEFIANLCDRRGWQAGEDWRRRLARRILAIHRKYLGQDDKA